MNSSPSLQALRVFLVEDTIPIRQRMAARLGAIDGVEIVGEAEEAGAALTGIDTTRADVVILDLRLTVAPVSNCWLVSRRACRRQSRSC